MHNSNVLEWKDLKLSVGSELVLLDGISGRIPSGEVCMLMGASGAGKTTLLNVLAGRSIKGTYKISGEILLNGEKRNTETWKRKVGYVEQFDFLHNFLTPNEILTYAARFKRVSNQPNSIETQERITDLIQRLGLQHIQHRMISTGISGGEKKRISIGVELIANPPFLFLDEPTSGLDAFNAYILVDMLHHLAKETEKCIILTVHQPRFEILELVDKLILMAKGKIIFSGTVAECIDYFEEKGFRIPEKTNPTDFFIDLITKDIRSPEQQEESLQRVKDFIEAWKMHEEQQEQRVFEHLEPHEFEFSRLNPLQETATLVSRETLDNMRNLPFQISRIIQVSIFIVILGLAFLQIGNNERSVQNRIGILFFLIINVVFTTMNPYLNMFPQDRQRIVRERASDSYRGWTAYLAKLVSAWPTLLLVNFIYATALYWMIGLQPKASNYFIFVLIILLVALFSQIMALTVGAFSENVQVALIAAPTILVVMVIFGGNFVNPLTLPGYLVWLYWISPVQFGFKAASQNEFIGLTFVCSPDSRESGVCFANGEQVLNYYYLYYPGLWTCILILLGIDLGIIVIGMIALEQTTKTKVRI